uniref:Large ribosomal subunit protein uL6c n=1 Tax=Helminthocladia australis TaxID=260093 RepID=A0A1G4NTJ9_9FLOR|nr:Ribosomal protein L6 [Helminthocladia australis]SCW22013.1 Ribosomal protein L6 [Helminthocladia australis]
MSRIGKQEIVLSQEIKAIATNNLITIEGPKGKLSEQISNLITVKIHQEDKQQVLRLTISTDTKEAHQLHGLSRTLINNMVIGVKHGFQKHLEIRGVGYRSQMDGDKLVLNVGYSHPVVINPPNGIHVLVDNNTNITVTGTDKCTVGQVAATIRAIRPPEPYKGKGIRYKNEVVKKKVGKAGK